MTHIPAQADAELSILADIVKCFDELPDDMARKRVLQYLTDRHTDAVKQKYSAQAER